VVTRRLLDEPAYPAWFKVWFAFCGLVGLAFLGLLAWAIVAIVLKVTR
jgi:hypothetical protein